MTGTVKLLGRRGDEAAAVQLARHHGIAFFRLVPLTRGYLVFANGEAEGPQEYEQ